jgi:hypothetical protein
MRFESRSKECASRRFPAQEIQCFGRPGDEPGIGAGLDLAGELPHPVVIALEFHGLEGEEPRLVGGGRIVDQWNEDIERCRTPPPAADQVPGLE